MLVKFIKKLYTNYKKRKEVKKKLKELRDNDPFIYKMF